MSSLKEKKVSGNKNKDVKKANPNANIKTKKLVSGNNIIAKNIINNPECNCKQCPLAIYCKTQLNPFNYLCEMNFHTNIPTEEHFCNCNDPNCEMRNERKNFFNQ